MTPSELLVAARDLTRYADPSTGGRWPRAAALLARQALEAALDELWTVVAPGVEKTSGAAQLLCLREYLDDEELAERAAYAWSALSRACHHHVYELVPTVDELARWMDDVEAVAATVERVASGISPAND